MKETRKYSTFAVMFYINKGKAKKSGLCTIMGRISVSGEVTQFSTKINIDPMQWDAKAYRLKGKDKEAREVNIKLEEITNNIISHYRELIEGQSYVTAELLKNRVCNIGQKKNNLLALYQEHNDDYKKMVGVNRSNISYIRHRNSRRHTEQFLQIVHRVDDIALNQLNYSFIEQYNFFLRGEKGFNANTAKYYITSLRRIVTKAINQGIIRKDPFANFTSEPAISKVKHMDAEDMQKMMTTSIKSKALCFTRDMFIFSTFTGLSFVDMVNFKISDIHSEGRRRWIALKRQKTSSECYIPLLEIPRKIIKKYKPERKSDKVFNMVTSATMRENLEKISKLCGITNHVSYHQSRHNFGTLITLLNGVSLETVSKMMGHSKISTTEIYARITSQKVGNDMKQLSKGLKDKYTLFEDNNIPIITKNEYYKHMQNEKR